MAMPTTGALIGTPASMRESVPLQTLAIDVLPSEVNASQTILIVYEKLIIFGYKPAIELSLQEHRDRSLFFPVSPFASLPLWNTAGNYNEA